MNTFQTIDDTALSTILGGQTVTPAAGPNQLTATGDLEGAFEGITLKGQGTFGLARTDYGQCLSALKNATPADIRATCGMPAGARTAP